MERSGTFSTLKVNVSFANWLRKIHRSPLSKAVVRHSERIVLRVNVSWAIVSYVSFSFLLLILVVWVLSLATKAPHPDDE